MAENVFAQFAATDNADTLRQLQQKLHAEGYSLVYRFVEDFRGRIKSYQDEQMNEMESLLEKGESLLPTPGDISPSWQNLWGNFRMIVTHKNKVLTEIPAAKREGEWQVLLDNPYTHQEIVCYPGLDFTEAAYLYGYFRSELNKNEYIKLQKVENVMMDFGS